MHNPPRILLIDDEEMALMNLQHILKKQGYDIVTAETGQKGFEQAKTGKFDVILTDLRMEKIDGMKILDESRAINPSCEVIMITGYATVDSAIEAMKKGAYHYISKPYRIDAVRKVVAEAIEKIRLKEENLQLKESLRKATGGGSVRIITKDPTMTKILQTALQIAGTDCNVSYKGRIRDGQRALGQIYSRAEQT